MAHVLPSVSVIVPAYRAETTIARALTSVLAQPGVDVEAVVVVDGLHDRTAEVAAGFADARVLINERNQGAPAARNRGLGAATAPYVLFLDADDYLDGPLLRGLCAALAGGDADVVLGRWIWEEVSGGRVLGPQPGSCDPRGVLRDWLEDRWVPPCAVLWRRDFLLRMNGWNRTLVRNQDGELIFRALFAGARLARSPAGFGVYVQHDSPHRITRHVTAAALETELRIARWLVAELDARGWLDDPVMRRTLIRHAHRWWRNALKSEVPELAARFQALWRSLGGCRHEGPAVHWLGATLLGLERKERLAAKLRPWLPGLMPHYWRWTPTGTEGPRLSRCRVDTHPGDQGRPVGPDGVVAGGLARLTPADAGSARGGR